MSAGEQERMTTSGRFDPLIDHLHLLRLQAGQPSYADLARTLAERRVADGADAHAARIAKSTLHDAFRHGRARINVGLTREIAAALGGDAAELERILLACEQRPTASAQRHDPAPVGADVASPGPSTRDTLLLALACIAVNLVGREFVDFFRFPIYLDMIGTAVAAIVLGPWRGAGVGLATNVLGIIGSGWISLPFALVNMAGALVWGYGVRRMRLGLSLPRFFALNLLTALVCTSVAVPVIVVFLGDYLRVGHDAITQLVQDSIDTFVVAVGFSNILTSTADKLISGFLALVVVSALPAAFRRGYDLILVTDGDPAPSRR